MRQYEIWWASLAPPVGRRPVLLLSRDSAYTVLNKVIVAEVTSTVRDIPVEVRLGPKEGLSRRSVANLDNVHVVARSQLASRIGSLAASRVGELKRAVGYAFDWRELKYRDRELFEGAPSLFPGRRPMDGAVEGHVHRVRQVLDLPRDGPVDTSLGPPPEGSRGRL